MDENTDMLDAAVCALLRGENRTLPAPKDAALEQRLHQFADYHGVAPLIEWFRSSSASGDGPRPPALKQAAAIELIREHELRGVLDALAESRAAALLLKGAALAYSLYPSPALRPRADTDLLIRSDDRNTVDGILASLGYTRPSANRGELITYQCSYVRTDRFGIDHALDVHWRINNTQLFSRTLRFDDLASRSVPIPALGRHARGLGCADALLLACLHRVHHFRTPYHAPKGPGGRHERLIWLYDIHLLTESMSREQLEEFVRLARAKEVRAVCADGITEAQNRFGTRAPANLLSSLRETDVDEPSAMHLRAGGRAGHLTAELRSLGGTRERVALLGQHLFPPAAYMLEKYGVRSPAWLPVLYLRRIVRGTWKRIATAQAAPRLETRADAGETRM